MSASFAQSNDEGSFMPLTSTTSATKYIVSGWVKETQTILPVTYTNSSIAVSVNNPTVIKTITCAPSGTIIDGWQRIIGILEIPPIPILDANANIKIDLNCSGTSPNCYFDDIRFYPYDGSLKSFVYDEDTQRLIAELDENNYATFYEYDLEGGLIRVKKETEKGIYTIQETRSSTAKITP
ncbi:hypothetical protein DMB65_02850 [Flavobacterium cheongpyeongense]|uniref:Uncharacterized protein n=2 Tax=Flavobacterium cheongpyeongense TaxID=2212651 RepID=A0A2V4BWW0_9FLAO|nr:hypothetical protein DMB65_02850 [Flavobacterium cheongpyeongense]